LFDCLGHIVSQVMGRSKIASQKTDISVDCVFQHDVTISIAQLAAHA